MIEVITNIHQNKMSWPSGLRRNVKAVVFIGVGSNPTDIICFAFFDNFVAFCIGIHDFFCSVLVHNENLSISTSKNA